MAFELDYIDLFELGLCDHQAWLMILRIKEIL